MGIIDPTAPEPGRSPEPGEPPLVCAHCSKPILVMSDGSTGSITLQIPHRTFDGMNMETQIAVSRLCRDCFAIWLTLVLPVENRIFSLFTQFISESGVTAGMKRMSAAAMIGELVEKMVLEELMSLEEDEKVDAAALGRMIGETISTELATVMTRKEADA